MATTALLSLYLVLTGCVGDQTEKHEAMDRAETDFEFVNTGALWEAGEEWMVTDTIVRLGVISGDAPFLFSNVLGAVRLSTGRIVVLDGHSSELRAFSSDEEHEWSAGGPGRGPGEFTSPKSLMRLKDDHLQVEDELARVIFDADGQLVTHSVLEWARIVDAGTFSSECRPVPKFLDNHVLLAACDSDVSEVREMGPWRMETALVRTTWSLDRFDTIGVFLREDAWAVPASTGTVYMPGIMAETGIMAVGGHPPRLVFSRTLDYRLEVFDLVAPIPERIRIIERSDSARLRAPSRAELDDAWTSWDARAERSHLLFGNRRDLDAVRRQIVPPDSISVASGVFVDDLNVIWVNHRAEPLDTTGSALWGVFSESGRFLGEVALPSNLTPHQIAEDFIVGVLHDEFQVEYVVVLALERSDSRPT
jgi:hypothetical protein